MFHLKSSLDSEKIIKTWFKPVPGVEKLATRAYTGQRVIFGLLRTILTYPLWSLPKDQNKKFFGSGVKQGFFDPRSPKKSSKNILNTSPGSQGRVQSRNLLKNSCDFICAPHDIIIRDLRSFLCLAQSEFQVSHNLLKNSERGILA